MKNFVKILVAILSLVMVLSMVVACKPDDQPDASSGPEGSKPTPGSSSNQTGDNNNRPAETDINAILSGGYITGADFLDGKVVAENGGNGAEKWTGTTLEGYAIMSNNVKQADTKSEIEFSVAVSAPSLFKFSAKVDSDEGDIFYVAVDGKKSPIGDLEAGEYDLGVLLTEGEHKVRFVYQKDSSGNDGTDTVYVSNVVVEDLTAKIDGVKDAAYDNGTKKNIKVPGQYLFAGGKYNKMGGTAYITNDEVGLYLYVEIIDDEIMPRTDDQVDANKEYVQIYIDYIRSFEETGLFGLEYRGSEGKKGALGLGWVGMNPDGNFGAGYGFNGVEILHAAKETEDGYALELFIPLSLANIKDGTIGIGFQNINDGVSAFYSGEGDGWYGAYETLPTYTLK